MGNGLKRLREEAGWTHEVAAEKVGISRSGFIKLERGERQLTARTINLAAKAFGVDPAEVLSETALLHGKRTPATSGPSAALAPRDEITQPLAPRWIKATYGGTVEAGAFRAVEDFDDDEHNGERPVMWEPADKEFPDLPMHFFDVAGDSMNALKPRPIMPGDRVLGIPFEAFRGRLALRDGMVVVVEQTLDGGHHRERSVKQVELYDDRIEFHPRSTNARHKPIVVPKTVFTDPSEGDGREVNVLAICRRISNELPL